jgi:hypothetical protein
MLAVLDRRSAQQGWMALCGKTERDMGLVTGA